MHRFETLEQLARAFTEERKEDFRQAWGGKTSNLLRLIQEGIEVPAGFAISSAVVEELLLSALKSIEKPEMPREAIAIFDFPETFQVELRRACAALGSAALIVRSSASDEDSSEHSYAGLLESVGDLHSFEATLEAVRSVWLSFYAKERLLYPSQAVLDGPVPEMSILVQRFVEAELSGVCFTTHPTEGAAAFLINFYRGACAEVVSGGFAESLTLTRAAWRQELREVVKGYDTRDIERLTQLLETALRIEAALTCPQDIEFVFDKEKLYIVQSRDIVRPKEEKNQFYSNINVGEALAGVMTPMTWSLGMSFAKLGFETLFRTMGLYAPSDYHYVTTFYGHVYLNMSELFSLASQLPGIRLEHLSKILGIASLDMLHFDYQQLSSKDFIQHLPRSLWRGLSCQIEILSLDQRAKRFQKERDAFAGHDLEAMTHAELAEEFKQLHACFLACGRDMLLAASNFLLSYLLSSQWIAKLEGGQALQTESYLFSGLHDIESAAPGFALLTMAQEIQKTPDLVRAFLESQRIADPFERLDSLKDCPEAKDFLAQFQHFLREYGARAHQEVELAKPRWREDPSYLLQILDSHLKSTLSLSPSSIAESARDKRRDKTEEFWQRLKPWQRPVLRKVLDMAQAGSRRREQWRSYVVDMLAAFRRFALAVAKRLCEAGQIKRPEDVFFLSLAELQGWLNDPESLRAMQSVAFRKARHQAYESAASLPENFVRHPQGLKTPPRDLSALSRLQGLPASPGVVHGRVRVIRELSKDAPSLQHGEIIVAISADVAWTPLFLIAAAILTERGGPLSHAFVVAREYGIPAIVAIPKLLRELQTGDEVWVHGQDGYVVKVAEAEKFKAMTKIY